MSGQEFPQGFPDIGDIVRFTCQKIDDPEVVTVEASVLARKYYDELDSFYLVISDPEHQEFSYDEHEDGFRWGDGTGVEVYENGDETETHVVNFNVLELTIRRPAR